MVTKEYIKNLSKLQTQIEDLVHKRDKYTSALEPIIKQYCKIENITFDAIGKIEVDTGEINPSYIHVTYIVYGCRGSQDEEHIVEIPVSFFINENAVEEHKAKRESEKNIAAERERQRKIRQLNEQVQNLKIELEKLVINERET